MPEWLSIALPDWALAATLASLALLLVLVLFSLVLLISVVRQTRIEIGHSMTETQGQLKQLATILEETGPIRYALAGLVAIRREERISSKELQEELESLLRDYEDLDSIVDELKMSLLTLDDQTNSQREDGKRGNLQ